MLHLNIAFKYRSTFTYWFKLGMLHKKLGMLPMAAEMV